MQGKEYLSFIQKLFLSVILNAAKHCLSLTLSLSSWHSWCKFWLKEMHCFNIMRELLTFLLKNSMFYRVCQKSRTKDSSRVTRGTVDSLKWKWKSYRIQGRSFLVVFHPSHIKNNFASPPQGGLAIKKKQHKKWGGVIWRKPKRIRQFMSGHTICIKFW